MQLTSLRLVLCLVLLVSCSTWIDPAGAHELKLQFLSKTQSADLIAGPGARGYFDAMHGAELLAKTRLDHGDRPLAELRDKARQYYADETLDFSADEMEVLEWALRSALPSLIEKAPLYARSQWKFAKISANIEGGLPHTRAEAIVLSAPFLKTLIAPYKSGNNQGLSSFLTYILVHEQTHVLQRTHQTLFDDLATTVLGFHQTQAPNDPWLLERRVVNPDAPDNNWVYPISSSPAVAIFPYLILSRLRNPRMPQDLQLVAVMATQAGGSWQVQLKDAIPVVVPLMEVKAYTEAFPNKSQVYHPYEISADLLGYWMAGHSTGDTEHPMRAGLAAWAAKNLR